MEIARDLIKGEVYVAEILPETKNGHRHSIKRERDHHYQYQYQGDKIGFTLLEPREDVLSTLFKLFVKHPESFEEVLPNSWYSGNIKELSEYLSGVDAEDEAQVLSIALFNTGWSKRLSTNTKLAREHLKRYEKEFKSNQYGDALFWDVSRAQWGLKTWKKIHSIPLRFFTPPIIKRCADPEYVDFAVIATKIPAWFSHYPKTKVRDFIGKRGFEMKWANLPVHHKVFRDYVLDLTIREYGQILNKIPVSTSAEGAVAMADEILGRVQTVNTVEVAIDAYVAVAAAADKITSESYWIDLNRFYLQNHAKTTNLLSVAKGYAETFAPRTMTGKNIQLMNEVLFKNNRGRWCASAKQCDYIAGRLIEITGSPRGAWDVIVGAYSSDKVLTFSKWEAFLNEWDTFKDMPSDLAVYLV